MSLSRNPLLLLLFLLPAALLQAQGNRLHLSGAISGLPHVRSVQLILSNRYPLTQPVPVADGAWSLRCNVTWPRLALLSFVSDTPLNGSVEAPIYRYNVPIFVTPGSFTVETAGDLAQTRLLGSEAHDDYLRLEAAAAPYEREIQRWRELASDSNALRDFPRQVYIGRKIDSVTALFRERVYGEFLKTRIASPLTPNILRAYWALDADPERMLRYLVNLPRKYRDPHVNAFRDELERLSKVTLGQAAPDFHLRDTSGTQVALSQFRGKYVLVEFRGSWCVPCRLEAPNLVQACQYFRNRNLMLLGVSVERQRYEKDAWLQSIREDSLPGPQVWDYRFWDSPVLKKYAIQSIPQNVLVDPNGIIVARNLRGEHLWAELDRLLSQQ